MHGNILNRGMKKLIIAIGCLCWLASCAGGKKTDAGEVRPDAASLPEPVADSVRVEEPEEEPALPETMDESFADFFYNFSLDEKMQLSRIVFPLACYTDLRKDSVEKDRWEYRPLFSELETYSVLFDEPDDMEREKDTLSTSVRVEWIYLRSKRMKRYYFERINGRWMLEAIDDAAMPATETPHENFYEFYERFANDSAFQAERLAKPVRFVTADPDDEFRVMETTLEDGQWFAFKPALPTEFLTNVSYGQKLEADSRMRVIELKGFGNGFNNTLYFRCRNGEWRLTKFEDLSD